MKTYSEYLEGIFPGVKVQKISVDAGFSCPNRDGNIGTGGCIYCRNDSFSPKYCDPKDTIKEQLKKGKDFFGRKYPEMKYLAFFQSFTGTYNKSLQELENLYLSALEVEDVIGLVIATRPDCLPDEIVRLLEKLNVQKPIFVELGAETSDDKTLRLINRNHTWKDVIDTVQRLNKAEIRCGLHLIAGLPGEDKKTILQTIKDAVSLPIDTIKLHQLQVLKGTPLLAKIESGEITVPEYSLQEYLELCREIVAIVPDNIIIERFISQSPPSLVISPSWGIKNYQFMNMLQNQK